MPPLDTQRGMTISISNDDMKFFDFEAIVSPGRGGPKGQ